MLPPDPHHFSIALLVKVFFVVLFSVPVQPAFSVLDVLSKRQVWGGFGLLFFFKVNYI